jgi:hypothetical protein
MPPTLLGSAQRDCLTLCRPISRTARLAPLAGPLAVRDRISLRAGGLDRLCPSGGQMTCLVRGRCAALRRRAARGAAPLRRPFSVSALRPRAPAVTWPHQAGVRSVKKGLRPSCRAPFPAPWQPSSRIVRRCAQRRVTYVTMRCGLGTKVPVRHHDWRVRRIVRVPIVASEEKPL